MAPLGVLMLWLAAGAPGSPCFVPTDQTAGWKRLTLPDESPALAPPEDVDWFRSGEPTLLVEEDTAAYAGAVQRGPGRMAYHFRVPPGTRALELGFLEDLRGAKVDAQAYAGGAMLPLLDERRRAGTRLVLEWAREGVDEVVVTVHHHLRERPVVRTWRVSRQLVLGADPALPPAFQVARSLYFRHPGGRRVELCDAPGRPSRLQRWPDAPNVPEVTLSRP